MIGIFDSGIGGITVLKEIIKVLPNYHYIYYSDSINNPYGDKSKEDLCNITKEIVQYLLDKGCDIIVIACNTASSICKSFLRNTFDIPIIAIEPALKLVYNQDGNTLIMATEGTLSADSFLELYKKFNNGRMIIKACSGLADLIENNKKEDIKEYLLDHLVEKNISNVVLGCTHYPLIKNEIMEVLGDVNFFDGSRGVAKYLKEVIDYLNFEETEFKIEFIDSSNSKDKEKRFYEILKLGD